MRFHMGCSNKGFTILEVVMVLAVLAVLAGVMAPFAVREINASRKEATLEEMSAIEDGLLAYYRDCGRLPETKSGVIALIKNVEGLSAWQGPYLGGRGDVETGITTDSWGQAYTYERNPTLKAPALSLDYILLSPGSDQQLESKLAGGKWTLDTAGDLVLQGLTRAVDGGWEELTRTKLKAIDDGLVDYYLDVTSFPSGSDSTALVELISSASAGWAGPYVQETAASIARDPWKSQVILRSCTEVNGESVAGWLLLSYGSGPPDAKVKGQKWTTGDNDLYRVIPASRLTVLLDAQRQEETRRQIRLVAAQIMITNPTQSPESGPLPTLDPWGRAYQYLKKGTYSGVLYSLGPDGIDSAGSGDDLYEPLVWPLP